MDEPLFDQRLGKSLNLRAKRPRQTSDGQLQQTASLDQGPQYAWLTEDALIAFRVGKDSHQAGRGKFGQQPVERDKDFVRQFKKEVSAAVRQRENLSAANFSHQVRLNPNVGARKHSQRQPPLVQSLLELKGGLTDRLSRGLQVTPQLVRSGDDGSDSIVHGHLGHRQRLLQCGRSVVQTGQQVAMDINEWFGFFHDPT
jgi:hypothetical protein